MTIFLIFISWISFSFYFFYIYRFQKKNIFFNSSVLVFLFFLIYYSFPILFNIFFSSNYSYDYRLKNLNITNKENFYLSLNIFIGCMGFLVSLIFIKIKNILYKDYILSRDYLLILLIILFFLSLIKIYFLNFGNIEFTTRSSAYLFAREMSVGARLLNKFVSVSILYIQIIFLFKIFQYYSSKKLIIWFFIFLYLLNLYLNFNVYTQRSEIFMQITVIIIAYNLFVNNLSIRSMLFITISLFFILISWGSIREGGEFLNFASINKLGEFDMIYANFIDLYRDKPSEISLKTKFYDFYGFIPSFLLWFEKSSLSIWFLQNYHPDYYALGGGYGFGILSESIYGFGLIETFFKTFLLSLTLNYFYKKYLESMSNYYEVFYIILFITAPQSIRNTSFSFMVEFIQFGLIINFVIFILKKIIFSKKLSKNSLRNVR
jgi:hypothetical protein